MFGAIGVFYYVAQIVLCAKLKECKKYSIILNVIAIVFILMQSHFLFRNWKMRKTKFPVLAKFGTMHLVATNVWTWIRFVLIEESIIQNEIQYMIAL